ncbi:MAG: sulfatase-like hydrolase/transferase, partial [Chloroflexota bacterium]
IVIIQLDDMRAADWSYLRKTRKLLSGAAWHPNYIIEFPRCAPSRATMLTGQFSHNHGVYAPNGSFPRYELSKLDRISMGSVLRDAGYRTGMIGKFINGYRITDAQPGGWTRWVALSKARHFGQRMNVDGGRLDLKRTDFVGRTLALYAEEFIEETGPEQPLFLYFNPVEPHMPAEPERAFRGRFPGVAIERDAAFNEADVSDKPSYLAALPALTPEQVAKLDGMNRARFQMMLSADEIIADVIGALDRAGRMDNACIFVMSDNGMMLGHHRLIEKSLPYDRAVRVPMLAWGAPFAAGENPRLVCNADIAPTCAELAGTRMPAADGISLLGKRKRDFVPLHSNAGPDDPRTGRGLRSADLMYFEYANGEREFYDLRVDPLELNNLLPPSYSGDLYPIGLPGTPALTLRTASLGACRGDSCSRA